MCPVVNEELLLRGKKRLQTKQKKVVAIYELMLSWLSQWLIWSSSTRHVCISRKLHSRMLPVLRKYCILGQRKWIHKEQEHISQQLFRPYIITYTETGNRAAPARPVTPANAYMTWKCHAFFSRVQEHAVVLNKIIIKKYLNPKATLKYRLLRWPNPHLLQVKSQLSRHCLSSRWNVFAFESSDTCQCSPLNLQRLIHWPPSISGWNHSDVYVSSPAPVSVTGIIWVNWYVEKWWMKMQIGFLNP